MKRKKIEKIKKRVPCDDEIDRENSLLNKVMLQLIWNFQKGEALHVIWNTGSVLEKRVTTINSEI